MVNDWRSGKRQTVIRITGLAVWSPWLCQGAVRQMTSVRVIGGTVGRGFIPGITTALSDRGFNPRGMAEGPPGALRKAGGPLIPVSRTVPFTAMSGFSDKVAEG